MEEQHKLSYEELLTFLQNAPATIFFKDTECRYLFLSDPGMMTPTKHERIEKILGKTDLEIWENEERGRFYYEQDRKVLESGECTSYVSKAMRDDGPGYFQIKKRPVYIEGKLAGLVGFIDDITERVRLEKQIEALSIRDGLTGLYNRNYLKVRGEEKLKQATLPITVIMGDCNYLKKVNDTYGHEYGDMLLKRVARILQAQLPPESVAMRVGGDEFLVVCNHFSARQAEALIETIQRELKRQSDDRLTLDVAFGYHTVTEGVFDYSAAFHEADLDMYRNKHRDR